MKKRDRKRMDRFLRYAEERGATCLTRGLREGRFLRYWQGSSVRRGEENRFDLILTLLHDHMLFAPQRHDYSNGNRDADYRFYLYFSPR